MLTLLIGTDWVANRAEILKRIARDVAMKKNGSILIVPELISHETERRLCAAAGDTASRFAEVLTFTSLARRVSDDLGFAANECLDSGGRIVAMASAVGQVHSRLKAYASVQTKPEFLTTLVDAMDEFKRCCISSADLAEASAKTEGHLAQKLEELSLVVESYDALCHRGKRDPRDQMTWLLEVLEDSAYARNRRFYVDGFPDFTNQHLKILEHFISETDVTVSLNCDCPNSSKLAFEKAGETAGTLIQCAKRLNIDVAIEIIHPRNNTVVKITEKLFQGPIIKGEAKNWVEVIRTDSLYQECVVTAEKILELVRNGARYRQIAVVCGDMPTYQRTIDQVFARFHIPSYLTGTEAILDKSVIETVLTAMDAALGGFDQKDVLNYAKSMLSPIEIEMGDKLENYVHLWSVNGKKWLIDWKNHPDGLSGQWDNESEKYLEELNNARRLIVDPLIKLHSEMLSAKNIDGQVKALYTFFVEINLAERLTSVAEQMEAEGDGRSAQILDQLWDILINAIEQLHDVLSETAWDPDVFVRLFKLLLSQYDVGTIPTVLDAVSIGSVSAMRCQKVKHLFVIGAAEGNLPGYSGSTGILSDHERVILRQMGVPLTGGSSDGLRAEFAEIYGVFCGAEESVKVLCSGEQPSFVYRRLAEMSGEEYTATGTFGAAVCDPYEAAVYIAKHGAAQDANLIGVADLYERVCNQAEHKLGSISPENTRRLYGDEPKLSASQIDCQTQCRFSYFMKYGMRAKEQKAATIDPAEFGTYVHSVLENTVKEIQKSGGFKSISQEEAVLIAKKYSDAYAARFEQIKTERTEYLFHRNTQELETIVRELWTEMHESDFIPLGFEVGFGEHKELPPIQLRGKTMKAELRGFIDRVDIWKNGDKLYYRIVDYKTGKKVFDYCDIFNGLGLQMLLYLFAMEQNSELFFGDQAIPSGVQYFPARVPVIPADFQLTSEEIVRAREKIWKRNGLLLKDTEVLDAMASEATKNRLPFTVNKAGEIVGDLADPKQLKILKEYIHKLLGDMIDEIASGCIDANPYSRGSEFDSCAYCPYDSVCHRETVTETRNYRTISAERFWEDVEKEVNKNG